MQRLGLWSDRVRARRYRLTHESRLMATSGRLLPGSLGRVGGEFVGIRHCSIFGSREPGVPREVVAMA